MKLNSPIQRPRGAWHPGQSLLGSLLRNFCWFRNTVISNVIYTSKIRKNAKATMENNAYGATRVVWKGAGDKPVPFHHCDF